MEKTTLVSLALGAQASAAVFGAKYLIFIALAFAAYLFFRLSSEDKKRLIKLSAVALPLIYVVALLSGHFFYNPRPFAVEHVAPLMVHADDNGFPSDHTLLLAAVASIFYFFAKKGSAILWLAVALVGISRVYVGVHHPIDIIGAVVIAALVTAIVQKWISRRP